MGCLAYLSILDRSLEDGWCNEWLSSGKRLNRDAEQHLLASPLQKKKTTYRQNKIKTNDCQTEL